MSSSDSCDEDVEVSIGCTFTWSIQNFSYCTLKNYECLRSPEFKSECIKDVKWWLQLYLNKNNCGYMQLHLNRDTQIPDCNYTFSIRSSTGYFKETSEKQFRENHLEESDSRFLSLNALNGTDGYLENDTLTLRCRIWEEENDQEAVPEHYYAHTKVKATLLNYTWILSDIVLRSQELEDKFETFVEVPVFKSAVPRLKLHISNLEINGEDVFHFGVEIPDMRNNIFIKCKVYILDMVGFFTQTAGGNHLFKCSKKGEIHFFPILMKHTLCKNNQFYLPNGKLTLRWELSFSRGINSELEVIEYGKTEDLRLKSVKSNLVLDGHEIWRENLNNFYTEEKLSDVRVCTPNCRYQSHRAILCAHSKVFSAMFEHDTKERQTGEIVIDDLEDDTVSKMLKFLYTNTLDEIDNSTALKLYYAADKYGIKALRVICSNRLKRSLDTSNVCRILALADLHRDEDLKSIAKDFIAAHAREVLESKEWKESKESNAQLTVETMEWLICNNFRKIEI